MNPSTRRGTNVFLLAATPLMVLAWFATSINGLWGYIFDGLLSVKSPSITLILMASISALIFNAIWSGRKIFIDGIGTFSAFFLFLTHLMLAAIMQSNHPGQNTIVTLYSFAILHLYTILLWICPVYERVLKQNIALLLILLSGFSMAIIGAAQHFSGDFFPFGRYIISKVGSTNSTTDGAIRANAFFLHGDDLGVFLSFAAGICSALLFSSKSRSKRLAYAFMLAVLAVGCYSTLTRTAYLSFILSTVIAAVLTSKPKLLRGKALLIMPAALFVVAVFIYNGRYILEGMLIAAGVGEEIDTLLSSASLDERTSISEYYASHLNNAGPIGWLFGLGWTFRSNALAAIPIDNGYLATVLNIGLIGLASWLSVMFVVWRRLVEIFQAERSALMVGGLAFFGQFMFLNVFGTHLEPQIYMIFIIMGAGASLIGAGNHGRSH